MSSASCLPQHPGTLVNVLFGGILQSQVSCLSCRHVSATYDPCMDLSLELGVCGSVEDALRRFTAVERLDGDNKYRCG
jgi:ubiquitin carboxyl-terminal hydrolase 36/42